MMSQPVNGCAVVTTNKPGPTAFAEPQVAAVDEERVRKDVIGRLHHFHARRELGERITGESSVVSVRKGNYPRTAASSSIRRKVVKGHIELFDDLCAHIGPADKSFAID